MGAWDHRIAHARLVVLAIVLLILILILILASLGPGLGQAFAASPSPIAASPGTSTSGAKVVLRVGWTHEPDNLNPFIGTMFSSYQVFNLTYDVLVGIDPGTMAPQKGESAAGLATDWTTSPDGKTWTFTLRHDAAWQDGSGPVTARDVAFSYNQIIDNELANFAPYLTGIKHVTAVDDYTVRFDCTQPKADVLYNTNLVYILPEHIWSTVPVTTLETSFQNKPPIVGSGPFQTVTFKKGGYVQMEANRSYWRSAPKVDEILFEAYTNEDTMAQEMKSGAIDACTGLLDAQLRMFDGVPGVTAEAIPADGYDNLVFNCYEPVDGGTSLGNPVLRDWRFRQALQWAVDKQKLVALAFDGNSRPGSTVIVPGFSEDPEWAWTPPADQAYSFDLAKAGQQLDAAGYKDTDGNGIRDSEGRPIRLRLVGRTENQGSQTEAKLMAGWFRQLGLKIDLQTLDSGALSDRIYNTAGGKPAPDFDMFIWGWYNALDPGAAMSNFLTSQIGGANDSSYSNLTFDQLWTEQARTLDVTKRKQLVDQLQQIIYQQSPYVVLTYFDDAVAWNTGKWTGWSRMPTNGGNPVIPYTGNASYLSVEPKTASTGTATGGGGNGLWWVVLSAVVVVAGVVTVVLVRRRRRTIEEASDG